MSIIIVPQSIRNIFGDSTNDLIKLMEAVVDEKLAEKADAYTDLEQKINELELQNAKNHYDIIKWVSIVGVIQIVTIVGLITILLK